MKPGRLDQTGLMGLTKFHDDLLTLVPDSLRERSGEVFYSGRAAFARPAPLYLLGLNPGGDPIRQASETVGRSLDEARSRAKDRWSSYADESWGGRPPGTAKMQPRVLHMMDRLGLDVRQVPASNVVFVRTTREAALKSEKAALLRDCWSVHQSVVDNLGVCVVACMGGTAGEWVRSMVGADTLIDSWSETNARRWTSWTHSGPSGIQVVTLTHPSIAAWNSEDADPSALVAAALARGR